MIRRVLATDAYPLRQQVLRPHQQVAKMGFPGEDDPATASFAAFESEGAGERIVGVATALHQGPGPALAAADTQTWWRLRGMAVAPDSRGRGLGGALLRSVLDYVAAQGGTALWCNARLGALRFYRDAGFVTSGDSWEEPGIGPHITMWRSVEPPAVPGSP